MPIANLLMTMVIQKIGYWKIENGNFGTVLSSSRRTEIICRHNLNSTGGLIWLKTTCVSFISSKWLGVESKTETTREIVGVRNRLFEAVGTTGEGQLASFETLWKLGVVFPRVLPFRQWELMWKSLLLGSVISGDILPPFWCPSTMFMVPSRLIIWINNHDN